jgi:hypothetical protein
VRDGLGAHPRAWEALIDAKLHGGVPERLGEYALKFLEEKCPKAGLAVQTETEFQDGRNTAILRKPTRLRKEPPRAGFIRTAIQRMSSELCGQYVARDGFWSQALETLRTAEKNSTRVALRVAGSLDPEGIDSDLESRARELKSCVEGTDIFLSPEDELKWKQAARRWLEAQYINSKEFSLEAYRL